MREIQDGTALREYDSGDGSWDQSLMPVPWNTHSPALASVCASLPCYQTASLDSFQLCGQHQCRSCCIWPWPEAPTVLSCDYIRACQPPRLSTCISLLHSQGLTPSCAHSLSSELVVALLSFHYQTNVHKWKEWWYFFRFNHGPEGKVTIKRSWALVHSRNKTDERLVSLALVLRIIVPKASLCTLS